jgi:hypothetical protein
MTVLVLKTDLFPDAQTLVRALQAGFGGQAHTVDLTRPEMEAADWERIVDALLAAEHIVVL